MKNLNLVRKIAWDFSKKTNIAFEDLFGEACLAYCESVRAFDEAKQVKQTTFSFHCVKNHLINYCKREAYTKNLIVTKNKLPEDFEFSDPNIPSVEDITEGWPQACKDVVNMIFENPEMYEAKTPNFRRYGVGPHRRLKRVKQDLSRKGWSDFKIENACRIIRKELNCPN